ncbi:hypothetical protein [Gimesia maris]|uniref:hypothetical protein n=1 Tax=Gimesia maris TaxID=122 RepID=UPI000154331E|nr:hypothetical protein [Gimesia maris]EDL56393.1 hypothetical protein PM8797T_16962 [Gimesia maris DSM 8797]QGQ31156.1 hypothetical protein F1729_22360 [Gimesia maris]
MKSDGAPSVWLLNPREIGEGSPWAVTRDEGRTFFFLSKVLEKIPFNYLQLFVAHELAHTFCIVLNEPSHMTMDDPIRREWIVWQLMEKWGFDQIGAEAWMDQNFDEASLDFHENPKNWEESLRKVREGHELLVNQLSDQSIPSELNTWL